MDNERPGELPEEVPDVVPAARVQVEGLFSGPDDVGFSGTVIAPTGTATYWKGKQHSFGDEPAIVFNSGKRVWSRHGVAHRDGGLPARTSPDGSMAWLVDGLLHREGGPAYIIATGDPEINLREDWCRHGQRFANQREHETAVKLATHDIFTLYVVPNGLTPEPAGELPPGGKHYRRDLLVAGCRRLSVEDALTWWLSWEARGGTCRPEFVDAIRTYMEERQ